MEFRRGIPRYEILLISNDPQTIRIIKSYFERTKRAQFKVNFVFSCSQALEELQKLNPSSILLDRSLPEENRKDFLKRIKGENNHLVKTFGKNDPFFKLHLKIRQLRIDKEKKEKNIHEKPTKEFKINQYITLKLENGRTFIYVNHIKFLHCIRLTLNIQKSNTQMYDEIDSIDEAADLYTKHIFQNKIVQGAPPLYTDQEHDITPEQEFLGHCSNIQAWVEHDYDTRILKSNLSFPLLRKLTEAGDPLARKVFKKEIILRFEDGYPSVVQYLINQGYLSYLTPFEIESILETNNLIEDFYFNQRQLHQIKNLLLKLLKQKDLNQREDIAKSIAEIEGKITTEDYKVIVVGDFGVGKWKLLTNLVTSQYSKLDVPKRFINFIEKPFKLENPDTFVNLTMLSIWDQTHNFKLYPPLLQGIDGVVLVFDTTRSSTFSNVNNWMNTLTEHRLSDLPRVLVGNKVDIKDERKIILPMAEHLSQKLNAPYFETSALTGENVKKTFRKIAELINEAKKVEESQDQEENIHRHQSDNLN